MLFIGTTDLKGAGRDNKYKRWQCREYPREYPNRRKDAYALKFLVFPRVWFDCFIVESAIIVHISHWHWQAVDVDVIYDVDDAVEVKESCDSIDLLSTSDEDIIDLIDDVKSSQAKNNLKDLLLQLERSTKESTDSTATSSLQR